MYLVYIFRILVGESPFQHVFLLNLSPASPPSPPNIQPLLERPDTTSQHPLTEPYSSER